MAEGAGLLNRFTAKSRNGGSNPPLSAIFSISILRRFLLQMTLLIASIPLGWFRFQNYPPERRFLL